MSRHKKLIDSTIFKIKKKAPKFNFIHSVTASGHEAFG